MEFLCYLLGFILAMFSIFWFSNGEWQFGILVLVLDIPIFFVPTIFERINPTTIFDRRKTLKTNGEFPTDSRREKSKNRKSTLMDSTLMQLIDVIIALIGLISPIISFFTSKEFMYFAAIASTLCFFCYGVEKGISLLLGSLITSIIIILVIKFGFDFNLSDTIKYGILYGICFRHGLIYYNGNSKSSKYEIIIKEKK